MNKPLSDPTQPYRSLAAGYNEAIRASDLKANIAFLFVAFMMSSVLYNYTSFPNYLPIQLVMLPFLIVYRKKSNLLSMMGRTVMRLLRRRLGSNLPARART